jgi:hypothetical protein
MTLETTFAAICNIRSHRHRFATVWKATFAATVGNVNPGRAKNLMFYECVGILLNFDKNRYFT